MKCENCGASVSIADPSRPTVECPYCHTVQTAPRAPGAAGLGEFFADRDGDGVPDVLQSIAAGAGTGVAQHSVTTSTTSTVYEVNGQRYASRDEMPADVRRVFDEGQRLLADGERLLAGAGAARGAAPRIVGSGSAAGPAGARVAWRKLGVALFVAACIAAALLLR